MKKIFCFLAVVGIFASCSGDDLEDTDGEGDNFSDVNTKAKEGFVADENHIYGFDSGSDDVIHISIPKNETGYVKVLTDENKLKTEEYYFCNPENKEELWNMNYPLNSGNTEHRLEITNSFLDKIALCRKKIEENVIETASGPIVESKFISTKVKELYVHRYYWKSYDFNVYTFGSKIDANYRFLQERDFWNKGFDTVYRQAIVEYDNIYRHYGDPIYIYDGNRNVQREYILSRARGDYKNDIAYDRIGCVEGDIDKVIDEMENIAWTEKKAIIQIDYPTKRFWPLKIVNDYEIEICGKPDLYEDPTRQQSPPISLVLEPLPKPEPWLECEYKITPGIPVIRYKDTWYLQYGVNDLEEVTKDNAHPGCAVFAEKNTYVFGRQYVGEIPLGSNGLQAAAAMIRKPNKKVATVVLPWQGALDKTKRAAYHELGHTMGLDDVGETTNLMYLGDNIKSTKLRGRSIKSISNKQENQWKCLQEENVNSNCASPNLIYRGY